MTSLGRWTPRIVGILFSITSFPVRSAHTAEMVSQNLYTPTHRHYAYSHLCYAVRHAEAQTIDQTSGRKPAQALEP